MGMLLPRIDVNHFNKALFNFSRIPVLTRWCFNDEFSKSSNIFSLFFFQVARVLPGMLHCLSISLFRLPFSNSFNASYYPIRVTS